MIGRSGRELGQGRLETTQGLRHHRLGIAREGFFPPAPRQSQGEGATNFGRGIQRGGPFQFRHSPGEANVGFCDG